MNYIVVIGLLFFVVFMLSDVIKPNKKAGELMFSSALLTFSISAMLTGEVGIRSGTIKRQDNPSGYWFMVIFFIVIGILMIFAFMYS